MAYRCLLIAVVCCVLPLIGSAYAGAVNYTVTITQPADGGTFEATTPNGTVLNDGANTVADGTVLTLVDTPNSSYFLSYFLADDAEVSSPYTVTGDITLTAKFIYEPEKPNPPIQVKIEQPAAGGIIKVTTPDGIVLGNGINSVSEGLGKQLTLEATPDNGYRLVKFTADGVDVSSPYTALGDVILSAEFEQIVHTVTIAQPADGGTFKVTTPSGTELNNGANTVAELTMLTLTPAPTSGYRLVKFTAGGVEVSSPYTVTGNVTLSAEFELIPPPPTPPVEPPAPTIYHTVTFPAVEGAITDPIAGDYEVEAWSSFRFYLSVDKEYDLSVPVVTTSRGETITPRSSDGAYIIKYVRQPLEIFIDGIVKNPDPVGNEVVATDAVKVWAAKGNLHINTTTDQTVQVYNLAGLLVKQADISSGDTCWQLPSGIYIVRIDNQRYKVIL